MTTTRRVLIAISLAVPVGLAAEIDAGRHPRVDYLELSNALDADIVDYTQVPGRGTWADVGVALECFRRSASYDTIITMGESIGIPLALLLRFIRRRPRHVMIGHFLSSPTKRLFFDIARIQHAIDHFLVYSPYQIRLLIDRWRVDESRVTSLTGFVDPEFFEPNNDAPKNMIVAAGMEQRDYPTLISAAEVLSGRDFLIKASSPWISEPGQPMSPAPDNVHVVAELISHEELRDLYDQAACVVVPLHNSDYAAGLTTALEALSMNVPLVMTETRGMRNSLDAGNIWWVSAADAGALAATLESLSEDVLPATRPWIQKNCAPPVWTNKIVEVIHR